MLLVLGLLFLALSAGLGFCAVKSKPKEKNHIRLMPLFSILAFISLLSSLTFIMGGAITRVSVTVYGNQDDKELYQHIVSTSGRRYKFFVLNNGQRGNAGPVAYSCNDSQLRTFVSSVKRGSNVDIGAEREMNCASSSSLSNFFDPHINLYLR